MGWGRVSTSLRNGMTGYRIGTEKIFCPWDLQNYIQDQLIMPGLPPQLYWANTSSPEALLHVLRQGRGQVKDKLQALLSGNSIAVTCNEQLTYPQIAKIYTSSEKLRGNPYGSPPNSHLPGQQPEQKNCS